MGLEHPPSSKTPPPLSCQASPLKSANYSSPPPFFEHLVGDSTPPRKRGGAHYDCN